MEFNRKEYHKHLYSMELREIEETEKKLIQLKQQVRENEAFYHGVANEENQKCYAGESVVLTPTPNKSLIDLANTLNDRLTDIDGIIECIEMRLYGTKPKNETMASYDEGVMGVLKSSNDRAALIYESLTTIEDRLFNEKVDE